eukprot:8774953-Alexandrium_andersonii.AAC.1
MSRLHSRMRSDSPSYSSRYTPKVPRLDACVRLSPIYPAMAAVGNDCDPRVRNPSRGKRCDGTPAHEFP